MTTTLYLDGKKISIAKVKKLIGEERYSRIKEEAKETYYEDPFIENSFFIGKGILTFKFS